MALFDIGCLLFGDYVQASVPFFNLYIDLRQITPIPNLFQRGFCLHAYAGRLEATDVRSHCRHFLIRLP